MKRVVKTLPFFELFLRFVHDSERGKRLQPNGTLISKGTIRNYRNTFRLLKEFSWSKQFELRIKPGRLASKPTGNITDLIVTATRMK
jgi:hypothetical protein